MAYRVITLFALIAAIAGQANAQTNGPVLMMDFSQNNNTYTWENSFHQNFDFKRLRCDLSLNSNSILLKEPSKRWQEQFSMGMRYAWIVSSAKLIRDTGFRYEYNSRTAFTDFARSLK